jgi:TusA-related sulfurtransferase
MSKKNLDITGKVCPYCLLAVQKEAKMLKPSDELIITCDNPAAATTSIPQLAADLDLALESKKVSSGLWEIRVSKK